ncbi:hypothetical protein AC578_3791 [Pseudocercospora eumusae]|uniref:Mitochondrial import inner membrane translocase subunit TIM50 n=1 Tax=Pseudocercospora eumusae TaxID=321146 RepID=A0A139HFJ9_9PEZI|nr:hypothetical protein AC578_3791 [Pseudocercospora eumusae]
MLPRAAALRASRATHLPHLRHAAIIPPASIQLRTYASSKPPRSPPPPPAGAQSARPPPPKNFKSTSARTRQTSPGTAVPKDQTWKPEDGIKFGGASSTPSGVAAAAGATVGAESPVQGKRTVGPASSTTSPLEGDAVGSLLDNAQVEKVQELRAKGMKWDEIALELQKSLTPEQQRVSQKLGQMHAEGKSLTEIAEAFKVEMGQAQQQYKPMEPMAQKFDADEPAPGGIREETQRKEAVAENQAQPPESPQSTSPLPDLRYGIPSTFDLEFGQAKAKAQEQDAAESQEDKLDLTSSSEEGQRRKEGEERDYDRSAYETSLDRKRAQLMNYFYAAMTFGVLLTGFYLSRPYSASDELPSGLERENADGWSPAKMWARFRARFGNQAGYYTEPAFPKLLPDVPESQRPPYTLVLSLEDLMIHTTWDTKHGYRTAKRPGIDYFIRYLSQYYELVLFTSVPRSMADPVVAKLDPYHFIMWPLGREATKYEKGEYVKDLSYLNRDLKKTIIIDTHAPHVKNQPENAIIIPKWSGDPKDPHTKDLVSLIPFLEYVATMGINDVRTVLKSFEGQSIPEEFARRESIAREKFQAQLAEERKRKAKSSLGSIAGAIGVKGGSGMGGGMVLADGQSVAEGLAQGKMLSDQIREQGQKQYEALEKQIRENGEQWLKEEAEEQKKLMDAQMKDMKQGAMSWFTGWSTGGGGPKKE